MSMAPRLNLISLETYVVATFVSGVRVARGRVLEILRRRENEPNYMICMSLRSSAEFSVDNFLFL